MKKVYSKPDIMFESFIASTNIAACGTDANLPTKDVCGLYLNPEEAAFTTAITGCNVYWVDDGTNGVCYHNSSSSSMLFGS